MTKLNTRWALTQHAFSEHWVSEVCDTYLFSNRLIVIEINVTKSYLVLFLTVNKDEILIGFVVNLHQLMC